MCEIRHEIGHSPFEVKRYTSPNYQDLVSLTKPQSLATVTEIARRAGRSPATVARALSRSNVRPVASFIGGGARYPLFNLSDAIASLDTSPQVLAGRRGAA